jgi:hypothetical protein
MAVVTKTLKDGAGVDFTKTIQDALGRQDAANCESRSLSNEDKTALDLLHTDLVALAGFTDGLEAALASILTQATISATAAADLITPAPVQSQTPTAVVPFTPLLDTAIYAPNDVLFATAGLTLARANNTPAMLESLAIVDKTKQKPAMTLFFFKANVTSGAFNGATTLSDADALNYLGHHTIAAADYKDLPNNSVACYKAINLLLTPATGTQLVYMFAILDAGTPTFALSDLQMQLGMVQS